MADPLRDAAQAPDVDWLLRQADLFIAMPDESWDTEALVSTLTDALRAALAAADHKPEPIDRGRWARLNEALDLAQKPLREDFEWLVGEYERLRQIMNRGQQAEAYLAAADGTTTPTPDDEATTSGCPYVYGSCVKTAGHDGEHLGVPAGRWHLP